MADHFQVTGVDAFARLARDLRAAGRRDLRRELGREIRTAGRPALQAARTAARGIQTRGSRGGGGRARARAQRIAGRRRIVTGLRELIAQSTALMQKTSGHSAGITIRVRTSKLPASQRALPRLMNKGQWRHPFMGNRDRWYEQTSTPAPWFEPPILRHARDFRAAVERVINDFSDQIGRG